MDRSGTIQGRPPATVALAFAVGAWGCVAAASLRPVDAAGLVLAGLVVGSLLSLWGAKDFPQRANALAWAWVGPGVVLAARFLAAGTEVAGATSTTLRNLVFLKAMALVGVTSWLFRGYGLISIAALVARMGPSLSVKARTAAQAYPMRGWWIVPLVLLVVNAAAGVLVSAATSTAAP